MQTVGAADGTGIAYETAGSGPPIVLLHGITEDRRPWAPIVDGLAPDFTCVLMDARGHGDSDVAVTDYEPLTLAGDIAAVIDAAGVSEPPLLVGHSAGAFQASVYAAAGSGPVRGVVNIDQTLRMSDFAARIRPLEADLRGPRFADSVSDFVDSLGIDRLDTELRDRLHGYHERARADVVLAMWHTVFELDDAELDSIVEELVLTNIRVPYLALYGSDPGPNYADWLTRRLLKK